MSVVDRDHYFVGVLVYLPGLIIWDGFLSHRLTLSLGTTHYFILYNDIGCPDLYGVQAFLVKTIFKKSLGRKIILHFDGNLGKNLCHF